MAKYPMFIVNETLPLVLRMSPNPNSISFDREKVYTQTQTLGGWVYEHWGEKPMTLRVKGRTLPVVGGKGGGKVGAFDTSTEVAVEASLFYLQQVYALDKRMLVDVMAKLRDPKTIGQIRAGAPDLDVRNLSRTFIYYKFNLYNGFFTNFRYEQNAEQMPRHYEYEFEFLVTSTAQSMLTDTLFASKAAPFVGFAQVGTSGDLGAGAALLAAGLVQSNVRGFTGLNI